MNNRNSIYRKIKRDKGEKEIIFFAIGENGLDGLEKFTDVEAVTKKAKSIIVKHKKAYVWKAVRTLETINGETVIKDL